MTEVKLSIVYLHETPEFIVECADLLNKQWSRSSSARIQSLEKSFKELPDSVLLLEETDGKKCVIGHSRLTRTLEDKNGCWIGSVVICEGKRSKGYGKYLMMKTEEYARKLNFSTVYLNTHDKQKFYERIGYQYCEPVSSINFKQHGIMMKRTFYSVKDELKRLHSFNEHSKEQKNELNTELNLIVKNQTTTSNILPLPPSILLTNLPPPPPPPLLPPTTLAFNSSLKTNLGQYWMKKQL